ncbi:hypothetical protein DL96DRAFT_759401 [Flagelloscypha sp. PMI_526]|nr:hypothetical protein DL96DRAFT_759401 [Flagelloscypha sp. PMI_526]
MSMHHLSHAANVRFSIQRLTRSVAGLKHHSSRSSHKPPTKAALYSSSQPSAMEHQFRGITLIYLLTLFFLSSVLASPCEAESTDSNLYQENNTPNQISLQDGDHQALPLPLRLYMSKEKSHSVYFAPHNTAKKVLRSRGKRDEWSGWHR